MKRLSTIPAVLAIFIVTSGFQIRPPIALKSTTNVTLNTNDNVQTTFETLARNAGLQVMFVRNFPPSSPVAFQVQNRSVPEALDLLSKQTGTFWTLWDSGTILVAPDTQQNRRDFERQFVATISLSRQQDPQAVVSKLPGSAAVGSTIVLRSTLDGIEKASEVVAASTGTNSIIEPRILGATAEVFLTGVGAGFRSTVQKRSVLRIPTPPRISLDVMDNTRAIYEALAKEAGLNISVGRNFPNRTTSFRAENMDFFDALDSLSLQSRSLWQPIDANTIQVLEDTQQNRRDFELQQFEIIYLGEGTTTQRLNEIMVALRSVLSLRGIYQYEPRKAIVLRDTPGNVLLVEDLVATLENAPTLTKAMITDSSTAFSETGGGFHSLPSTKAALKLKTGVTPMNLNQTADIRTIYENIATSGGLGVVFGRRFPQRSVTSRFEKLDVTDALDRLALESGTFWQPLDDHTILVLEDTQQNRRDYETHTIKTILLPVRTTPAELTSVMNVLRTSLSLRGVFQSTIAKAIVIHDTPNRVEVVEKLIRQLIPNPNAIVSLTVPAPNFAETKSSFTSPSVVRTQLSFTNSGAISLQSNQDSRGLYESLAGLGGIKVNFDSRFTPGTVASSRIAGIDVPDALDRLSIETGNYWTVLDNKTILVAPDTAQVRQQFEPQTTRTVGIKTLTPGLAGEIVTILRTALGMREVNTNGDYSITMKDSLQRVAIAEQIIANLDRP
jgi:hypothetical protein